MTPTRILAVIATLALAACGDSTTEPDVIPEPTYESISGIYVGSFYAEAEGIGIEVDFIFTLSQNGGNLTGLSESYHAFRDLSTGLLVEGLTASGNFTGTIGTGPTPAVTITETEELCGLYETWTGIYDSANNTVTLNGTLRYVDPDTCEVVLELPAILILKP